MDKRIQENTIAKNDKQKPGRKRVKFSDLLKKLPNEFTSEEAFNVGRKLKVSERTIARLLRDLCTLHDISRVSTGNYRKNI